MCKLYQQSLNNSTIPTIWKTSEIIPIAKKPSPSCLNDYRPVALTPILMKCFEKVIKHILSDQIKSFTDPLQFAYTKNRCVEDATLCLIDYVLHHLDKRNTSNNSHFAKILYIDFSSAFNTIQPHFLMQKLNNMSVHPKLILWLNEFLTNRVQYVKFLDCKSTEKPTNTGAPQGCVLSPLLFTLYTSDCRCVSECCKLIKYADDTALVGCCTNDDKLYRDEVTHFAEWCELNYLELNVSKTKQMIVDFRKSPSVDNILYINDTIVENVTVYKYLGSLIDNKLAFSENVDNVYKKIIKRVYFVRQLYRLDINSKIIEMFYNAVIQSVISFSITCWYGNCTNECKDKITKVINMCRRFGIDNASLKEIYIKYSKIRYHTIIKDCHHPLHNNYQLLPSGRRYKSINCRTSRYLNSFVPSSIRSLNDH